MKIYHSEMHKRHTHGLPEGKPDGYDSYFENPRRIKSILTSLIDKDWAEIIPPTDFGLKPILDIHTLEYINYLKEAYDHWKYLSPDDGFASIPYKPGFKRGILNPALIPDQDGFFMTDMNVTVNKATFPAAVAAVNCGLSTAKTIFEERGVSFALCRPPGHHAGSFICGGFCYLNNAAVAANWLSEYGKVAILDIDYHAGNGTQSIFYDRNDVLTISLHADPVWEYPTYAGYAHETGAGYGKGYHRNFPLPHQTDDSLYTNVLSQALELICAFEAEHLIISAGFDTFDGDPLGDFKISREGFRRIGKMIASLKLPTGILLEGGYQVEELGWNVTSFLEPFTIQRN